VALVRLASHGVRLCRCLLNFAHVSVVHSGRLPIVPGDRNRIPARFGDNATISGIAPPINLGALIGALDSSTVIVASPDASISLGATVKRGLYLVPPR
jgi:hypothetical protein